MALATPVITATYAEIALKGRNRSVFMRKLINNIRVALKGEPVQDIQHVESRLLIWLDDPERASGVTAKLRRVFGLQWVSPAVPIDRQDVEPELAEDLAAGREPRLTRVRETAVVMAAEARRRREPTRCKAPWSFVMIDVNGQVVPCYRACDTLRLQCLLYVDLESLIVRRVHVGDVGGQDIVSRRSQPHGLFKDGYRSAE